jgi:hypothetical protein
MRSFIEKPGIEVNRGSCFGQFEEKGRGKTEGGTHFVCEEEYSIYTLGGIME